MLCRHCGASNPEEDHRCSRCGRRLTAETARPTPETYPTRQSPLASTRPNPVEPPARTPAAAGSSSGEGPPPRNGAAKPPFQPALFPARDLPQVLPMDSFAPQSRQSRGRTAGAGERAAPARENAARRQMDLYSSEAPPEVVRFTNAPVASVPHRLVAAGLDCALVLIAVGFSLIVLQLLPGEVRLTNRTMAVFGAINLGVLVPYKLVFCLLDVDPPGMRWTSLRLLNFDGRPPTRTERLMRLAAACLGVSALGLGILWPLVDAETLSWHDHMSKTFATPVIGDRSSRR